MNRRVPGLVGVAACLACGGVVSPREPVAVEAPAQAAIVQAEPAKADPAEPEPEPDICCSMYDHAEWTTLADCTKRKGERWWRYDLCGSADATSELLEPTAEVAECGYTHREGGKIVLVETVSTGQAVVTLNGAQRRLKLNHAPEFQGPPDAYTYEDRDDDLRVDVVRDEVNETAKLDVYWGGWLEHRSTRSTFAPCGD